MRSSTTSKNRAAASNKAGQWQGHVEAWRQSGLSQKDYCAGKGIALSTFTMWRRRLLATTGGSVVTGTECVDIVAIRQVPLTAPPFILELRAGRYRVEIADGFQPDTLKSVLDMLEAR